MLPTTQFAHRKGHGTCDALLCVVRTLQSALKRRQEARIVEIDFYSAFDRVTHQGSLFTICCMGIGGFLLSVMTQFPSNRLQYIAVGVCRSKLVNVVSGEPKGSFS